MPTENRYSVNDKEALAFYWCTKNYFSIYVIMHLRLGQIINLCLVKPLLGERKEIPTVGLQLVYHVGHYFPQRLIIDKISLTAKITTQQMYYLDYLYLLNIYLRIMKFKVHSYSLFSPNILQWVGIMLKQK